MKAYKYKNLIILLFVAFCLFTTVASAEGSNEFTLSGAVIEDETNRPIGGVTIYFDGEKKGMILSDSNGNWVINGMKMNSYTRVTADKSGYFFGFNYGFTEGKTGIVIKGFKIEDYKGVADASGRITDKKGRPLQDVTIFFDNDNSSVLTDKNGYWSKHGVSCEYSNTIEITPYHTYIDFEPKNFILNGSYTNINFVGTPDYNYYKDPNSYVISGRVTTQTGQGVPGVSLTFSDGSEDVVTDSFGNWLKEGLVDTVTVKPYKPNWTFISPYMLVGSPSSMVNFVATPDSSIKVKLDTRLIEFTASPYAIKGKTFVPMKSMMEALGANVTWNPSTQTITATKDKTTVKIKLGSVNAYINDTLMKLPQTPVVKNNTVFVPLSFVTESMKARVYWYDDTKTIEMYSNKRWAANAKAEKAYVDGTNAGFGKESIPFFDQAIKLDPMYVFAYHSRATTYQNMKEYDKALADINKAIEIDADFENHYYRRGLIYTDKNDYEKAAIDYTKALSINSKLVDAYYERGYSYYKLGKKDDAIADYKKVLELDPTYMNTRELLRNLGVEGF